MNVRKAIDYSELFRALNEAVNAEMTQMELYCEIGRLISQRPEKGAAVATSEYLTEQYPELSGFSPRNLRRMRDFYKMYADAPEWLKLAKQIGWTQNAVLLEADLTAEQEQSAWYLQVVLEFGWSKNELKNAIETSMHKEMLLDYPADPCYTMDITQESERNENDQYTFYLSRQYLQESDGRVYYERLCEESRTGAGIPDRVCCHQPGENRESGLSSCLSVAQRAGDRLFWQNSQAASQSGLREIRFSDWNGSAEPAQYVSHLRRGFCRQNAPADGLFRRPPRRCSRPLVHKEFQGNMAGCDGRLSGAA